MQIEITLDQLNKFIDNINPIVYKSLWDAKDELEKAFYEKVFTYWGGVKKIEDMNELRKLISAAKGRPDHRPGRPRQGERYNTEYLERKERMGIHKPHIYENYSFLRGTDFNVIGNSIIMKTEMPETSDKTFDYLTHHEKRRSVLKLTFLKAWQNIIKAIIERLAKEAKKS